MDSWGSQDILAGFEPADPRSNRGESVILNQQRTRTNSIRTQPTGVRFSSYKFDVIRKIIISN
jgi:hypothetical protein